MWPKLGPKSDSAPPRAKSVFSEEKIQQHKDI